jgi:glycosyltransferase involved in cell wall biosynthesis
LPLEVFEAMAAGPPVITTPVGGIPEVVFDGETGVLVQPGDVAGIAEAIIDLAGDASLYVRLRQKARERETVECAAGEARELCRPEFATKSRQMGIYGRPGRVARLVEIG